MITISVVSHDQASLLEGCLLDLVELDEVVSIIVTKNIPENDVRLPPKCESKVTTIINHAPKGFAENHNAAFRLCQTPFFCVINPDVRLPTNSFATLIDCLSESGVALTGPLIITPRGDIEDSARSFPTLTSLLAKAIFGSTGRYNVNQGDSAFPVDWLGGMFMLFRSKCFNEIGGFDENFFLYYEDVDICARLWKSGFQVMLCPKSIAIHDARRTSRHDLRYMRWHLASMVRYYFKYWRRIPRARISPP